MVFIKIAIASLVTLFFYGGLIYITGTRTTRKIVHFNEGVSQQEKDRFISAWELYEVVMLMDLPITNSMVFQVPDSIASSDLAQYLCVKSVEDDRPIVQTAIHSVGYGEQENIQAGNNKQLFNFYNPDNTPLSAKTIAVASQTL
ncbi:MAG: hypothetical protein JW786_12405 [Desulfobacterales bacterium]|nr:hypothetical protein [Desulfobacterales bacterium]